MVAEDTLGESMDFQDKGSFMRVKRFLPESRREVWKEI
jgi:hypothetical protein